MTQLAEPQSWQGVRFGPRRLAHGNFFVRDVETSLDFYQRVCGLTLVFREPGIQAIFLSNGNSHHDVALMGISTEARIGRDGQGGGRNFIGLAGLQVPDDNLAVRILVFRKLAASTATSQVPRWVRTVPSMLIW